MKLKGTKFQVKIWVFLKKIPKGSVKTYTEVAKAIGKPLAIRAVANACLLYTSPSPRDLSTSRMPSSA